MTLLHQLRYGLVMILVNLFKRLLTVNCQKLCHYTKTDNFSLIDFIVKN